MKKWISVEFESSSGKTPQFKAFVSDLKKFVKQELGNRFEIIGWAPNHFDVSFFLKDKNTDSLWYVHVGDLRDSNWHKRVLYRTAKHEKDYTGGFNQYCGIMDIGLIGG